MSNERDRLDDPQLSDAYRDLAVETTPEHLDRAILKQAASAATRSGYARAMGWTRPLAWAATVALTLFVTLQLTEAPTVMETSDFTAAPAQADAMDAQKVEATADDVDDAALFDAPMPQSPPAEQRQSVQKSADTVVLEESVVVTGAAPASRASVAESFEADGQLLERAEETANLQSGSVKPAEPEDLMNRRIMEGQQPMISTDSAAEISAFAAAPASELEGIECPEALRETAEQWLECIGNLVELGQSQAAADELEAFKAAFPEVDTD